MTLPTSSEPTRGSGTAWVAQQLRDMIVVGQLPPGQRISERAISDRIGGLSRTPLREAFKVLEAEGLITVQPNRGAIVTALDVNEVNAAMQVLIGLESMAAEPACAHITDRQIEEIEALHAQMELAHQQQDLKTYFELNQRIHANIVAAAGNPVLMRIYLAECARIRRYRYAGNLQPARWAQAVQEHRMMLQVLRQRAGAVLRELLKAHHLQGWQVSREILERESSSAPSARKPR